MSLPNVIIELGNGNLGQVSATDDGIAGLILTGSSTDNLELNEIYVLGSFKELEELGVTSENNPLVYKDVKSFYQQAGEGSELHLIVVSDATTLSDMCDITDDAPLKKLINYSSGRIRLVGLNKNPDSGYSANTEQGFDGDAISAATLAQQFADVSAASVRPFRLFMPVIGWDGETITFKPRESSWNRVAFVIASDGKVGQGQYHSIAIGQVLGRASKIGVHQSLGRVRDGSIAVEGYLSDGTLPEETSSAIINQLHDAGYIFYRTIIGKNGYYLNGDAMAAPLSDDYAYLNLGRVIDKAIVIAYTTYIDDLLDNIEVDDKGQLPVPVCKEFEGKIRNAVLSLMGDEISSFSAFISPEQNVLSTSALAISCSIVPLGVLREINVKLSFSNPAL